MISGWNGPRVQNKTIREWSVHTLISDTSLTDTYVPIVTTHLLGQQKLSESDVRNLTNFLKENGKDSRAPYVRGILRTQTNVTLNPEQKSLAEGPAVTVHCEPEAMCTTSVLQ